MECNLDVNIYYALDKTITADYNYNKGLSQGYTKPNL